MIKLDNKILGGLFFLVGIGLIIFCVIFFTTFSFNKKEEVAIMFFEDSVNGLDIDAPVKYKGVKIGTVKEIYIHMKNQAVADNSVPVLVSINNKILGESFFGDFTQSNNFLKDAIEKGVKARLQPTSLLTGKLYIELNYFPGRPFVYHKRGDLDYFEIPTTQSNIGEMMEDVRVILSDLSKANFAGLSKNLNETMGHLNDGIDAINFQQLNKDAVVISNSVKEILNDSEFKSLIQNSNELVKNLNELSRYFSENKVKMTDNVDKTIVALQSTLKEIEMLVATMSKINESYQNSFGGELIDSIRELSDTAYSIRAIVDYLYENPNALLRGKIEKK